jgi:hypothetical protein
VLVAGRRAALSRVGFTCRLYRGRKMPLPPPPRQHLKLVGGRALKLLNEHATRARVLLSKERRGGSEAPRQRRRPTSLRRLRQTECHRDTPHTRQMDPSPTPPLTQVVSQVPLRAWGMLSMDLAAAMEYCGLNFIGGDESKVEAIDAMRADKLPTARRGQRKGLLYDPKVSSFGYHLSCDAGRVKGGNRLMRQWSIVQVAPKCYGVKVSARRSPGRGLPGLSPERSRTPPARARHPLTPSLPSVRSGIAHRAGR